MKVKSCKLSNLEVVISAVLLLLLGIPLGLNFINGWNPLEQREQIMTTVIRAASNKGDSLKLETYSIEGVCHNVNAVSMPQMAIKNSFSLDADEIKIIDEPSEELIEISHPNLPVPHSFNSKILLVTGRNVNPAANADE